MPPRSGTITKTGIICLMRAKIVDILFKQRRTFWYRINIVDGVSDRVLASARKAAAAHKSGTISNLRYTENKPEWVLLYEHIKNGQIHPDDMKHMRKADLEYLSGMSTNPPGLDILQSAKLQENVARAVSELNRRNSAKIAVTAALIGAGIGALATLLAQYYG